MPKLTRRAIDNAGHRFRRYEERPADLILLQEYRTIRCNGLESIFCHMASVLVGTPGVLSCRVKRIDTIIRKLRREGSMDLSRMDDVIAFRIVTESPTAQLAIINKMQKLEEIRKIRDYTKRSASGGYRAIHVIIQQSIRHPGSDTMYRYPCEIQIRTLFQHLWSTTSESFGEQVKEGGGPVSVRLYLNNLSEKIELYEKKFPDDIQQEGLSTDEKVSFIVIVFDKKRGLSTIKEYFDEDLNAAIARVLYLEELYRADFGRETVLVGVPTSEGAEVTHLRYFRFAGIPQIPEAIFPSIPRPIT